ncbi:hypothetical protein [Streptomyces sp. NBC_00140]|uniref:hypothetical protein n=1 Tax=Streptomyces sp. NBC_00140 TaxID=2975664 RepID=UPI002251FB14|nr:hypothetical protein [Streptomyces sp. NBC_00140]MCX5332093.1 hypothetical protein [Streptomyces sp. NBC_00140]
METSDVIATIALTISIGTFVYDMRRTRKLEITQILRDARIAFRLGVDVMEAWQMLSLVGQGEPDEIARFREQVLVKLGTTQALAEQLGINVELREIIEGGNHGILLEGHSDPFSQLRGIIEVTIPDKRVIAAYEIGTWVNFLNWALRVGQLDGDASSEMEYYSSLVVDINNWINELGIDDSFNPELHAPEKVAEEAQRLLDAVPKWL